MDQQFSDMHRNPDVVVATPGRLLHVVVEMELQLSTVEYVVFDEADRCVCVCVCVCVCMCSPNLRKTDFSTLYSKSEVMAQESPTNSEKKNS